MVSGGENATAPDGKLFYDVIQVSETLDEGDSGAPIFSGHNLYGVGSYVRNGNYYATQAAYINTSINLTPLTYQP